jgi:hypothetical protein
MIMTGSCPNDWILFVLRLQSSLITIITALSPIYKMFQFTVAHALGFSVSTSRVLATDLNTESSTSNYY